MCDGVPPCRVCTTPAFLQVNHRDVTGEIVKLGAHGTQCRLPIGTTATFAVKVPVSEYMCSPSNEIFVDMPTELQTWGRTMLPAHVVDLTFVATEPAWPQVTDASTVGYFHRLRTRARRTDLVKASEERLGAAKSDTTGKAANPPIGKVAVEFEYHPPAKLAIQLTEQADPDKQEVVPETCSTVTAVDTELKRLSGYVETILSSAGTIPEWVFKKGTIVDATTFVVESLPYPDKNKPETCDWVAYPPLNGQAVSDAPPVEVSNWNMLGIGRADLEQLQLDKMTAEYKEFMNVLGETVGNDDASVGKMSVCVIDGAAGCTLLATRDTATANTDQLDDKCAVQSNGLTFPGYRKIEDDDACSKGWLDIMNVADSKYRRWFNLGWEQLTLLEQGLWERLGLADAYRAAATATSADWQGFSESVLVKSAPAWANLTDDERAAAALLQYTGETWGRQWAFVERMAHGTVGLLDWEDVANVPHEQKALEELGWDTAGTAWDTLQVGGGPKPDVWYADLTTAQKEAFAVLRITEQQWDNALQEKDVVKGCFWHTGMLGVTTTKHVVGAAATSTSRRRRRSRSTIVGRSRRSAKNIVCPAGQQSGKEEGACTPCPSGTYKGAAMWSSPVCVSKRTSCTDKTHKLHTHTSLFVHSTDPTESRVVDDTMCAQNTPSLYCPPGTFKNTAAKCTACGKGTFSAETSAASACVNKTLAACPAGYYFIEGNAFAHDDNMCVACPGGSFAVNASANTACAPKTTPRSCDAGSFLAMGTSTTDDDNACAACPSGKYTAVASLQRECVAKSTSRCAAGFYFYSDYTSVRDDNFCLACPVGTFTASDSADTICSSKSPAHCNDVPGRHLHKGSSATENDNYCVLDGLCAPGYFDDTASGCTVCASGHFLRASSNAASCEAKVTHGCPKGAYPEFSNSPSRNETTCAVCPPNTFSSSWSDAVCTFKQAHVVECPAGTHASLYMSTTKDDYACVPCGEASYMNTTTTTTSCMRKAMLLNCEAGEFLSLGSSTKEDDWVCKTCPDNTFTAEENAQLKCTPKLKAEDCVAPEVLFTRIGVSRNNECALPGNCRPGFQVASDGVECEACPHGMFNKAFTTSMAVSVLVQPSHRTFHMHVCSRVG